MKKELKNYIFDRSKHYFCLQDFEIFDQLIDKFFDEYQPERLSEKTYYRNEDGTYPHLESCIGSDSLTS